MQGRFEVESSEQRFLIAAEWQHDLMDPGQQIREAVHQRAFAAARWTDEYHATQTRLERQHE